MTELIRTANGTILVKHWLLVTGQGSTPALLEQARLAALLAMPVFVSHWGVLTTDQHGVDAEVARTCETWAIAYRVVGVTVRPTNGARNYMRLIVPGTMQEKRAARDRWLIEQAARVIVIGEPIRSYPGM